MTTAFSTATLDGVLATPKSLIERPQQSLGLDPRFCDVAKIGDGGNSEIYRAFDDVRQEVVAIKRLRSERSNRQSDWDRFMNEPTLMSKIDHPVVPKTHDIFPERMFKPYFTTELIDGIDLCRVLSGLRGDVESVADAFPLTRLIEILIDCCNGLAAAHKCRIIHGDVKPENIMMTRDRGVRLVDWGSASEIQRPFQPASTPPSKRTRETAGERERRLMTKDRVMGTPLYMSPEQVRGDADIDDRSDVYSMGAVLYDCLALTTMIRAQTVRQVFGEILRGNVVPPSQRSLRKNVSAELDHVCMKATATNRADRFRTITEFRDCLQATAMTIDGVFEVV